MSIATAPRPAVRTEMDNQVVARVAAPAAGFRARALVGDAERAADVWHTAGMRGTGRLLELGGTGVFATSSPVQQAWRDVHFAAAHSSVNKTDTGGRFGRIALGVEETSTQGFS